MGDLTEHFSKHELWCRCCGRLDINARFLQALEDLRGVVGKPIVPTSGYRCHNHPLTLLRPGSPHAKGMAADIWIKGMSVREMGRAAEEVEVFRQGGIGLYPNAGVIHVDSRMEPLRWIRYKGIYTYGNDLDKLWEQVMVPEKVPK